MRGGGQAADARCVPPILGVESEFQDTVFAAHLLVVPVVIAVVEFCEIGVALDKARFGLGDYSVGLWCGYLLRHSGLLAKPCRGLEAHSGARDAEAVVGALPDCVEPLVEV